MDLKNKFDSLISNFVSYQHSSSGKKPLQPTLLEHSQQLFFNKTLEIKNFKRFVNLFPLGRSKMAKWPNGQMVQNGPNCGAPNI